MKTEVVKNIANEALYQLQYYENSYLEHEKINEICLILFSTMFVFLVAIHM